MGESRQIIKIRNDPVPVLLERDSTAEKMFKLAPEATCSWLKTDVAVGTDKLRSQIEPWLTALVQSEHLSLLIGSGLTHAVHWIATEKALPGMGTMPFGVVDEEIAAEAKHYTAPHSQQATKKTS